MNCKITKEPFKFEFAIKFLETIAYVAETLNSVPTLFFILVQSIDADYKAITSDTLPVPSKSSSSFEPSSHLTGKQESLEPVLDDGNDFVINYYINVSFRLCS